MCSFLTANASMRTTSIDMLSAVLTKPRPSQHGQSRVDAPFQAGPNPLPSHFDQAERAGPQDLGSGAVAGHGISQGTFDLAAMAFFAHVDEVIDDHAAQVAQPQLSGDFLGGGQDSTETRFPRPNLRRESCHC